MSSNSCDNCSPLGTGTNARSEITFVDVNRLQDVCSIVRQQVTSIALFSNALHNLR